MTTVFFTGFPGFLGVELLPRVLSRHDDETIATCLVQPRYINYAKKKQRQIEEDHPGLKGRIKLVEGDITEPDLGLGRATSIKGATVEFYHLAAVYDLAVDRELAHRVNVQGTRHVLDFASRCGKLKRFQYVSTCYVSGRYNGLFRENDLDVGQKFNNHYEETKFHAERDVRDAMREGLPATIYRPAIVVGDSRTGATQKFDGPYYVLQWLLRLPSVFVFPMPIGSQQVKVNIVPRDFVVDAMAHLSGLEDSAGKCYQLCDPRPLKVPRLIRVLGDATDRTLIPLPIPGSLAKLALKHVAALRRWMRIPPESLDYFTHPTYYSPENMLRGLRGSGIGVPPFRAYVENLVDYMREHGEITSRAMV